MSAPPARPEEEPLLSEEDFPAPREVPPEAEHAEVEEVEAADEADAAEVDDDERTPAHHKRIPRRYLVDRCDGASKVGEGRPPLRNCYPPPCVKWCPSAFERNPACVLAGSCGATKLGSDPWRGRIFRLAAICNFVGMALTIAACMAVSLDYDLLMAMGFSSGTLASDNPSVPDARVEIGLRGVAADLPRAGRRVFTFDEFCGRVFRLKPVQYFSDGVCAGCADTSAGLVSTLVVSVFLYLPNIFTDFNRMHAGYDVNCQKVMASFVSLVSLLFTLYTWRGYMTSCFAVFYEGIVPFDREGLPLPPGEREDAFVNVDFRWRAGNGLICVVAATALKFVDILCNWLVPTPSITRDEEEQVEYENL